MDIFLENNEMAQKVDLLLEVDILRWHWCFWVIDTEDRRAEGPGGYRSSVVLKCTAGRNETE